MTTLPSAMLAVLAPFASVFHQERVFRKAITLLIGCILCVGGVTVCAALRALGLETDTAYCRFHRLLSRNQWNMLTASKILLQLIVNAFCSSILTFSIDDTIERRRGKKIKAKGIFKDPVGTGNGKHVTCSGLRWVPVMVLIKVPFMKRTVALPFIVPLSLSERSATKIGSRHKSPQRIAEQICHLLRRWFPDRTIVLVADSAYTTTGLFKACQKLNIQLVTRARSNLRFCQLAPPRTGKRGRPRTKGDRLPSLKELRDSADLKWTQAVVEGYGGVEEMKWLATLDCLWDSVEGGIIKVRLVFVKALEDDFDAPVFCLITSALLLSAEQIVGVYGMRWSQEVTHREVREHIGVETQRQWSDLAIQRTTPLLFGIYSLIFLFIHQLYGRDGVSPMQATWYQKKEPAFSDLLHSIRSTIREHQLSEIWASHGILKNIQCPRELLAIFRGIGIAA
jgi:DDE superfamily endonuclease